MPRMRNMGQPRVEPFHTYEGGSIDVSGGASLRMAGYRHPDGELPTPRILQDDYPRNVTDISVRTRFPVESPSQSGCSGEHVPQTYPTDAMQRASSGQSRLVSGGGPVACGLPPPNTSRLRPVSELRMCQVK